MKQKRETDIINETTDETKVDMDFDTRPSTVFYEQWYKTMRNFPLKERDKAYKYIFEYAFYGIEPDEPEKDKIPPMSYIVYSMAKPNIDSAQKRYDTAVENGQKSTGRPKKVTEEIVKKIVELRKKGLTQKEVADELSLHIKTIQRVEKDIRQNHNVNENGNVNKKVNDDVNNVASDEDNITTASPTTESATPTPPTELTWEEEVAVINEFKQRIKPFEIAKKLSLNIDLVNLAIDEYKERGYKLPKKPTNKILDIKLTDGRMYGKTKDELFNEATKNGTVSVDEVPWEELEAAYIKMDIPPFTAKALIKEFKQRLQKLNDMKMSV